MANYVCKIDSGKIVNGRNLFDGNSALQKWDSDLSSLENGEEMFYNCTAMNSFSCNNLNKLVNGIEMFGHNTGLQSFTTDMPKLESAGGMFMGCTNLTYFKSNLNSLTNADGMFQGCTLTNESVHNIASGLNYLPSNASNTAQEFDLGTRSTTFLDSTLKDIGIMKAKGWQPTCDGIYSSGIPYTSWEHQPLYYCTSASTIGNWETYKSNYIIDGVWNEHLFDLTDGTHLFSSTTEANGTSFTKFNADLSNLVTGMSMFYACYYLTAFDSNLNKLEEGNSMFNHCQLASFNVNLPSLTGGRYMFCACQSLTTFGSDLPSLTDGHHMLRDCYSLTAFNSDLPSLTDGTYMFGNCYSLTAFDSDLSSLINGQYMFQECYNLTAFDSDLSSLTNGCYMFYGCILDTASVQKIADTIKDVTSLTNGSYGSEVYKQIHIGIENSTPDLYEHTAFNTIASKGWTVYVDGNDGRDGNFEEYNPTALIPVDGEETTTPIPFWAKPVPATEETASYVDADGNYYNILGAQFIYGDDLSTYGMFTCEEEAAFNMGLTKIEK